MAQIDIPLPDKLTRALTPPPCTDLRLPKPNLGEIRLPTGGTIKAIPDITKGIPNDCSMNASLALQLAPMMASMECLLKVLQFLGSLISAINDFKDPVKLPGAVDEILTAAKDLAPCIELVIGVPIPLLQFLKDVLELIAKMLRCATQALKSVIALLDGLEMDIATAQQNGNNELLAQLKCAQENANLTAQGTMTAIEPLQVLLTLVKPFFAIAQQPSLSLQFPVSDGSLDSLKSAVDVLDEVAVAIQAAADAIPV
jgi:hypothetical protein